MNKEHHNNNPAGSVLVFVALAACATAMLAYVDKLTSDSRERNRALHAARLLGEVVPPLEYDAPPGLEVSEILDPEHLGADEPLPAYPVRVNGVTTATILTVIAPDGYVGPLRLLVGIGRDGRVTGVRVAEHRETPGLGDKVDRARSAWIDGFTGRSLTDPPAARWQTHRDGGDFDQISGATITSRAVIKAVRNALEAHAALKNPEP